jgi:hypothetical protein
VTALQRIGKIQALVEVRHQFHVVSDGCSDGIDGRQIVAGAIATEPQF